MNEGRAAEFQVILKKRRAVKGRGPRKTQLLGDDIQYRGFPRPVAAVEQGDGRKIQALEPSLREDLEGVNVVDRVAGHLQLHVVLVIGVENVFDLVILGGKTEGFQVDHGRLLSWNMIDYNI